MELEMLKDAIVKVLKIDAGELTPDTRFVEDLGADSLDMYQIAMNLEEVFDVSFSEADLKQVERENGWVDCCSQLAAMVRRSSPVSPATGVD